MLAWLTSSSFFPNASVLTQLITLDLWMDRASAEVFADNGMSVMTDIFFPTLAYDTLILETGSGITVSGHVCGLDSIWTS